MKHLIIIFMIMLVNVLNGINIGSFPEFQNHIKDESAQVADMKLHKQLKQARISREYEVGDQETYWRYDLTIMPPGWLQTPATCRAVGEHCYVFVADEDWQVNMDEADVQVVLNYLEYETMNGDDYGAVEMDTLHFGNMPDELDNDLKLIVFYSALGSYNGSTFDGYFSSYNQVTEAEAQQMNPPGHSNECEMIYMTCYPLDPTDPIRISVLAHELEHLIHWGGDINENLWVDEGLAELAMVYFGLPDPISQFNSNPDNSLITWNQDWADYVKTMLFFTYFAEQFDDGTIISDIVSESANSISGISAQLIAHGYTIPFVGIFNNWTIANYLDDPDVDQGQYNYQNLELPIFNITSNHTSYPAQGNGTTNAWASDYVRLIPNGQNFNLHLEVDHTISLGVLRISNEVATTVDFYNVDGSVDINLPEMSEEYTKMILVIPNSNYSNLAYNYEVTEFTAAEHDIAEIKTINLKNYPNPFNPATTIKFYLSEESSVELAVFNLRGQKITTLINEQIPKGEHAITWNGINKFGTPVSTGMYLYKLKTKNHEIVKRMLLLK
ncbi:MAG: T9SS type A sorting domain-containing protein [Candidatus Cloacimonetes bacterium]|nr:T9SS type A sorting domain-containing protein [Candidatus Cloacimonadota bacterium]